MAVRDPVWMELDSEVDTGINTVWRCVARRRPSERASPTWVPWSMFFLDVLRQQQVRLSAKPERERILLGRLPELSARLLDLCREHGRLTVVMAVEFTGADRNTVKDHLSRLTRAGHLARHGAGRGAWYGLS